MKIKAKFINIVHNIDARKLNEIVNEPIVDVTITSPPYFDLKDYGSENQIGYGQSYSDYLNDLTIVFKNVYNCTKDEGTLWVIIDAFRKDGEVIPLPFDFANKIKEIGWKLKDIIIWGKDRTVPWSHKGQMRSLFEYVLLFSKTDKFNFYIDEVRDFETLKKWWVKYPERYNPKGKSPGAIWDFDIPVQGSWGEGYIKHFCPLPEAMIAQILKISTKENDIVLDPFAGSGAVLSQAKNMKRNFIGIELNNEYIEMFNNYIEKTHKQKREEYNRNEAKTIEQISFQNIIIDLRALKYTRMLIKKLVSSGVKEAISAYVEKTNIKPKASKNILVMNLYLFIHRIEVAKDIENKIYDIISKAPLTKYGIEANITMHSDIEKFSKHFVKDDLYLYSYKASHKFVKKITSVDEVRNMSNCIVSNIRVDLDEKDYE